jgi:hypothetical protein
VRRAAFLAAAATAYLVAAWMVAPGFYDGFAPPQPYNFVCPPPQAGSNQAPGSGHVVIKVVGGVSDANSAFTDDGQIVIGFLPGSFDVTGKTSVTVDITPVSPCPKSRGLSFVTNAYQVTADAPLAKQANLVLRYSNLVLPPSFVYRAASSDGPWTNLGASAQAQVWTIETHTNQLGYFAAGYPSGAVAPGAGGTGQLLPIIVAVLIAAVLIAGIPLSVLRRRQARAGGRETDEEDDEE